MYWWQISPEMILPIWTFRSTGFISGYSRYNKFLKIVNYVALRFRNLASFLGVRVKINQIKRFKLTSRSMMNNRSKLNVEVVDRFFLWHHNSWEKKVNHNLRCVENYLINVSMAFEKRWQGLIKASSKAALSNSNLLIPFTFSSTRSEGPIDDNLSLRYIIYFWLTNVKDICRIQKLSLINHSYVTLTYTV